MSGGRGPAATRQNLLALGRRLERVTKGTGLLRRKRQALVAELFRLARPAATVRRSIAEHAAAAYPLLLGALAADGYSGLRASGWPTREVRVEIRAAHVWGIPVSELLGRPPIRRTLAARGTPPTATPAAIEAAGAFEELTELLLDAANREAMLARLGEALARTSRQVNTLERRVGPTLERQKAEIRRALDEREREERLRLERLLRSRG
ncbi:MAG TPA: V-type ATP synthase subunit D [Gemmatimonadales bacterium]|nr:V-type ATP synthase subunit D [Gemmatimonadales bacterium]